jgi:hypothetical protein
MTVTNHLFHRRATEWAPHQRQNDKNPPKTPKSSSTAKTSLKSKMLDSTKNHPTPESRVK